ncbi:glycosyl transferase family 64 domain-containing protein [Dipodascopsis tothii]|uniref:glycosyl transferase family 64 domain-containing protein n=1 Tax=Dipodascopsis tothii TaxID=44089 RepID=UPI0034CE2BC6
MPSLRLILRRVLRPKTFLFTTLNIVTVAAVLVWLRRPVPPHTGPVEAQTQQAEALSQGRLADVFKDQAFNETFSGTAAFATVLCSDHDFVAVRTLVHSFALAETKSDVVVVVMYPVEEVLRKQLTDLGAKLVDTEIISFRADALSDAENARRECRSNSIQTWRLTEYEKILFIAPEMLVLSNIDEVFQEPAFTATLELGGVLDDSMMLLEPNMEVYRDLKMLMMKSHQAPYDLGFINYHFKDIRALNPVYNVKAKYREADYGRYIFSNAKVYNFEGTLRPWNFWLQGLEGWRRSYSEEMIYSWRQADYSAREKLGLDDKELVAWRKDRGSRDVCESYLVNREMEPLERTKLKYSVMLATHSLRRQETLPFVIEQFLMSPLVDKVFLVWHNNQQPMARNVRELLDAKPDSVVLLNQTVDSLNNRFNPVEKLRTSAVLISDDDVWTPMENIDLAFESWQRQPDSLVGFAPRADCYDKDSETTKYCWAYRMSPQRYSIMLTKLMFMDANFLFLWRCGLPDYILKYVDDLINCEDIAMNFLVTGVTNAPPIHVVSDEVYDFGLENGISSSPTHWKVRGQCVNTIIGLFGNNTLQSAVGSVSRYTDTDFKSTTWDQFLDIMRAKEETTEEYEVMDHVEPEDEVLNDW